MIKKKNHAIPETMKKAEIQLFFMKKRKERMV